MPFHRLLPALLAAVLHAQSAQPLSIDILNLQPLAEEDQAALESMLDNPINLNAATATDLWFLEDSLTGTVLAARRSGPFRDWRDVAHRTGFSPARMDALRQFLYLPPTDVMQSRLSARIVAAGNEERIRTRLSLDGSRWRAQWVVQRDPGEYQLADLSDPSLLIRYGSSRAVLGAHRLAWGLGLVFANEFAVPRGEALLRPLSRLVYLRPGYSNTNTGALRGAGVHYNRGDLHLLAGVASQQTDITTDPDGLPRIVAYRSHAEPATTTNESLGYLAGIAAVRGWNIGGMITRRRLEATSETGEAERQVFSLTVKRSFPGQLGVWQAAHEEAWGADTPAREWSGHEQAGQTRLTFTGNGDNRRDRLRLTIQYRRYPPGWIPLRGRMVGDRVSRGNEFGWYGGWQWGHSPWKLSGYLDTYQQQEPDKTGYWPREGWESGLTAGLRRRSLEATLYHRYREETAGKAAYNDQGLDITLQQATSSRYSRFTLIFTGIRDITARLTAAAIHSITGGKPGRGGTFGGSLGYRWRSGPVLAAGVHVFDTDDWDHRLVVYEAGLPGEFSLRSLYGRGVRVYGKIAIPVGNGLISLRVARQWRRAPGTPALERSLYSGLQMDIAL